MKKIRIIGILLQNILYSVYFVGPAPDSVTSAIYELTKQIKFYCIVPNLECSISDIGTYDFEVSYLKGVLILRFMLFELQKSNI